MVAFVQHISAVCARACISPAGNVIFLPRGAVVIDIVPENNEDKSPWVVYMCADFKPLFISPIVIPPQKTVLQMAKVRRSKEWAMLTPYWRQRILREGVCPEVCPLPITLMLRRTLLTSSSGHAIVCPCYRLLLCMGMLQHPGSPMLQCNTKS